jgi:hypothetical protein
MYVKYHYNMSHSVYSRPYRKDNTLRSFSQGDVHISKQIIETWAYLNHE